jgi:hypothetical protein
MKRKLQNLQKVDRHESPVGECREEGRGEKRDANTLAKRKPCLE